MSELTQLQEAAGGSDFRFDFEGFEKIGDDFVAEVRSHSKPIAKRIEQARASLLQVVHKLRAGKIDRTSARRARQRYQRAVDVLVESLRAKSAWSAAQAYWEAESQVLDWLALLASKLITLI